MGKEFTTFWRITGSPSSGSSCARKVAARKYRKYKQVPILMLVWPCIINNDSKEESQLNATIMVYWKIQITSTCFGRQFNPSSGALDCALQLVECCTQYVAGRWSGNGGVTPSPDHRPWLQHTTICITQSNAPEDGQNFCPKYVELSLIYQ